MTQGMSIPRLQQMKRDGRKIVAVVAYDYQMAAIADRAGVDMLSVGDSVGVNLWGHRSELEVTLDQMILACRAVRRGAAHALVSCDFPFGPLQEGPGRPCAAIALVKDGGADPSSSMAPRRFLTPCARLRARASRLGAVRHHPQTRSGTAAWPRPVRSSPRK